jgi:hypothetical protein
VFSASSEARDRNAPTNANQIRLQTSRIGQEHRPIRYQLPARLSLRQGHVSYQAYISQISYLLFLKMDEERVTQIGEASMLPDGARWGDIKDISGEALNATYVKLLDRLSKQGGIMSCTRFG